jgi:hypothetical protein
MGKKLKKHLAIDGQIAKLASRGLIIEDEDYARRIQKLESQNVTTCLQGVLHLTGLKCILP